jgi:hypothetical protein
MGILKKCSNKLFCISCTVCSNFSRYTLIFMHIFLDVNECDTLEKPCINAYNCTNLLGGYECNCLKGWGGFKCQLNLDDCRDQPCSNGATCVDLVADYHCVCLPGYTGTFSITVSTFVIITICYPLIFHLLELCNAHS